MPNKTNKIKLLCDLYKYWCFLFKCKNKILTFRLWMFTFMSANFYSETKPFQLSMVLSHTWRSWGHAANSRRHFRQNVRAHPQKLSYPRRRRVWLPRSGARDFYWWMTHVNQRQTYLSGAAEQLLPSFWLDVFDEATPLKKRQPFTNFAREAQWKPLGKTEIHRFKPWISIFFTGIKANKEALDSTWREALRKVSLH